MGKGKKTAWGQNRASAAAASRGTAKKPGQKLKPKPEARQPDPRGSRHAEGRTSLKKGMLSSKKRQMNCTRNPLNPGCDDNKKGYFEDHTPAANQESCAEVTTKVTESENEWVREIKGERRTRK